MDGGPLCLSLLLKAINYSAKIEIIRITDV